MLVESLYADPVVAEIHEARRRLLEVSGGDVAEFRRHLRERQKASGRKLVSGPVKKHTEPRDTMTRGYRLD
jgi:hypothetical protein